MNGARRVLERHGWWLLATALVSLIATAATGWFLFPLYALANAAGTVLYLDGLLSRSIRLRRLVLPTLTVLMVPVGLLATLLWRRVDVIDVVLGDPDIRNHTAASNVYGERRHMSGP